MAPSMRKALVRILEEPHLVEAVRRLPPRILTRVIQRVGLEDASEIIGLATTEQIEQVFDDDLWKNEAPGEEELFDAERFAVWLEVMLEVGEGWVADCLSRLSEDLLTMVFHAQLWVFELDELAAMSAVDDFARFEYRLESHPHESLDDLLLVGRRHEGWDAILCSLLALDRDHHACLRRVLERIAGLCHAVVEEDGLTEALSDEEMLRSDVAGEREDRRRREGYVPPQEAHAFLEHARMASLDELRSAKGDDPITRNYFRHLEQAPPIPESGLEEILVDAGVVEVVSRARRIGDSPFERMLGVLHAQNTELHARRVEELAFVANVLAVGSRLCGRRFRASEAARAAVAHVTLGLETLKATSLDEVGVVTAFRVAVHRLHHEVTVAARKAFRDPLLEPKLAALGDMCPVLLEPEGLVFIGTEALLLYARTLIEKSGSAQ